MCIRDRARSGRSVGFVRADEGFYDRMDTAAYLRLFERLKELLSLIHI